MPAGIIAARIDPATGTRLSETVVDELLGDLMGVAPAGMVEHFYQEFPPPDAAAANWNADPDTPSGPNEPADLPGTPL
jgi:penicillin-binding protein 1A